MKNKFLTFIFLAFLFVINVATLAEEDPVKATIQYSPKTAKKEQEVDINITITNTGDTDIADGIVLHNPDGHKVSDFGDNGVANISVGSSITYKGKWKLRSSDVEKGEIRYYVTYNLTTDDGSKKPVTKYLAANFEKQSESEVLSVDREISPNIAKENQEVTISYTITNNSDENIKNIKVSESLVKKATTIKQLKSGDSETVTFNVTMKKKNINSSATVNYTYNGKSQKISVPSKAIIYGLAKVDAKLSASDIGIISGETVKLKLDLTNKGTFEYTNITVNDENLGEVFSGQTLLPGSSISLEKEVTLQNDQSFEFTINCTDSNGSKTTYKSNKIQVRTILESQQLSLSVNTTSDKDVFYDDGGRIKFTINVKNNSLSDAKNVAIYHRDTKIYTFKTIAPGQTKSVSRDFTLSQSGKYRFDAKVKNAIDEELTFEGNELNISVVQPTAPPVVITPSPLPALVTIAPKKWSDAPDTFRTIGRTFNSLAKISLSIASFFLIIILISILLRLISVYRSKSSAGSIKNIKLNRNYYAKHDNSDSATKIDNNDTDFSNEKYDISQDNNELLNIEDIQNNDIDDSSYLNIEENNGIKSYRRRSPSDKI